MRNIIPILLLTSLCAAVMTGCSANADQKSGAAQGYGGVLKVSVGVHDGDITSVRVTEHHETQGVGTRAIEALPEAIVQSDSVDVDDVTGATITSRAIKEAVSAALADGSMMAETIPSPDASQAVDAASTPVSGMGMSAAVTGGEDESGVSVLFAAGFFDREGRILSMTVDQLDLTAPEGDVALQDAVSAWRTRRDMGDDYMLPSGSWRDQMDAYMELLRGMTVDEAEAWFSRYFDEETGKPLTAGERFDALSPEDRQVLADISSRASISLRSSYGDVMAAIRRAWEDAKQQLNTPEGDAAPDAPGEALKDTNTLNDAADGENTVGKLPVRRG